jgi:hypothetical protein
MTISYVKFVEVGTTSAYWLAGFDSEAHPLQPLDTQFIVSVNEVHQVRAHRHHVFDTLLTIVYKNSFVLNGIVRGK